MKVLVAGSNWRGGMQTYLGEGFSSIGAEVAFEFFPISPKYFGKRLKLHHLVYFNNYFKAKAYQSFNDSVRRKGYRMKPDILFVMNGGKLYPETVKYFRETLRCKTVCYIADSPFDSSRDPYVGMSLRYYSDIFVCERKWIQNIRNVSPNSDVSHIGVGYDPKLFNYKPELSITDQDRDYLACDISFTGANYGEKAEGAYRAGILSQLNQYDLKIWGHGNWESRIKYFPELKEAYKGNLLPFDDLLKLYRLSKINLNMPSPQIITAFQPRVFEIAAAKGFQIVDYREDLDDYFVKDEMITFKDPKDLQAKVEYYLKNEEERELIVENLYNKIKDNYTWDKVAKKILNKITT